MSTIQISVIERKEIVGCQICGRGTVKQVCFDDYATEIKIAACDRHIDDVKEYSGLSKSLIDVLMNQIKIIEQLKYKMSFMKEK